MLDPYVILFVGSTTPQGSGRAVSRKVGGKGRTFNQLHVVESYLPVIYRCLHDILHFLPEDINNWNSEEVQRCVGFLRKFGGGKNAGGKQGVGRRIR